ncbi:hypothetical protein D187_002177 [Cystobacter fuscus DSM 2262]|uniref:Uncharacterized protein n=1 Tax=Cystobacter fuscus (strain ATCC 25194 / DSM 2262 / NBRC 100088 / M29) TaxID=1242864 RepID=S9PAH9_CYSF2|nr:hypothetical protein D187_002177 [Cystobacter fuscus DSM 2262]
MSAELLEGISVDTARPTARCRASAPDAGGRGGVDGDE